MRKANDNPSLGEVKTSHLRGQLAAMNKILDLASASSGSEVGPRTWEEAITFPGIGDRQPVDH